MKTRSIIGALAALILASLASAQTTADDPHLAKAVELRAQAVSAYGEGNYDISAELRQAGQGRARPNAAGGQGVCACREAAAPPRLIHRSPHYRGPRLPVQDSAAIPSSTATGTSGRCFIAPTRRC